MTLDQQIEMAQNFLAQYRNQQNPINPDVTYWFECVLESLHRLKDLEQ